MGRATIKEAKRQLDVFDKIHQNPLLIFTDLYIKEFHAGGIYTYVNDNKGMPIQEAVMFELSKIPVFKNFAIECYGNYIYLNYDSINPENNIYFADKLKSVSIDLLNKTFCDYSNEIENSYTEIAAADLPILVLKEKINFCPQNDSFLEYIREEIRHGKAFEGLLKRYFG